MPAHGQVPGTDMGPTSELIGPDLRLRRMAHSPLATSLVFESAATATTASASRPVFIVGSPRSGTTLVQSVISCSSELAIAPEHDFLLRFRARYGAGDFRNTRALEQFVDDFFALKASRHWKIGRDTLLDSLIASQPVHYRDVVRATYQHFATQHKQTLRWGAKVPYFALQIDVLHSMFPDLRVIHVVRDGRDVLASIRERTRNGASHFPVDARFAALRWKQLVLSASRGVDLLPRDQYLELRYEDLVADPEQAVRLLERFLECSIPEASSSHYAHALAGAVVHCDEIDRYLRPGITCASIARWHSDLTARDTQWFEAIAGDVLRAKGYGTGAPRVPLRLRLIGGLTSSAYSLYRHMPHSLKPTIRQHSS